MEVLSLFSPQRPQIGVLEASDLLGRSKSTVSRWLTAMEDAGFLEREGDLGRFRLSMRLATLGEVARQSTSLQRLARPVLERLTQKTGETSNLVVLSGPAAVNLELVESPRPVKHVGWLGRRLPLHATAAGKSLLAWQPQEAISDLLSEPLQRFTPATITDRQELDKVLERVRKRGYADAIGELEDDLVGIAAPVRDHTGKVAAAVTLSAPLSRVPRKRVAEVADPVVAAAEELSASLGHVASQTNS
jgi:DNA-binding IclR family transcriptional regulator